MSVDVTFTDASKPGPSGPITAWDIDFGDGSSHGSGPGPWTHTYAAAGDKTVTLVVTGTGGDGTDTIIKTVQVGAGGGSYASLAAALTYNTRAGAGADEFAALDAAGVIAAGGRHVVCTTRAQHNAAIAAIRAGDWIDCQGIHFTGQVNYRFSLSDWAKITYDSACSFTGATSQTPNVRSIYMPQVDHGIFLFDCDVTNPLGDAGILVNRCNHFVIDFLGSHSVHNCGTGGINLLPQRSATQGDIQNFFVRGEVHDVCQNIAYDTTHAEHGTGIHCMNAADSIGGILHHGMIAIWGHDCVPGGGSVIELGMGSTTASLKPHDIDIYLKGDRMLFKAKSQTAGNGLNAWGQIGANVTIHICEVGGMAGHGIHTDATGGTSKAGVTVLTGTAVNCCQNPRYSGQNPWMSVGGVNYSPGPFSPTP
jgi:PKD repeat protein